MERGPSHGNAGSREHQRRQQARRPHQLSGIRRDGGHHEFRQGPRRQRPQRDDGSLDEGAAGSNPTTSGRDMPGRRDTRGRTRPAASDSPAISNSTMTGDIDQPPSEGSTRADWSTEPAGCR